MLWGYGVKRCKQFLDAAAALDPAGEADGAEYRRYEEWLAGFVSGLSLATGQDILRGAEISAAMGRIEADCRGKPQSDFFNAAMDFVRLMLQLER